ncbi:MAG: hypothetical protein NT056_06310 [Proteobacteria bacterium]|nr:hypothetical protein [Pseudomonadota bacterium]
MKPNQNIALLKTDLLCRGIRVSASEPYYRELVPAAYGTEGKSRSGIAGSGKNFLLEYGEAANLGVRQSFLESSPYEFRISEGEGWILKDGEKVLRATVRAPAWHSTAWYDQVQLHGTGSLATALTNTCIYKSRPGEGCRFCIIDIGGKTVRHQPEDLARAIREIETHPELRQAADLVKKYGAAQPDRYVPSETIEPVDININSGTEPDGGIGLFTEAVAAIRRISRLPIGIQVCPLGKPELEKLRSAGVTEISFNLEVYHEDFRRKVIPGKNHAHPREEYFRSMAEAREIFGENQVESWIIIGLEPAEETIAGMEAIARSGGIPLPKPFRPLLGSDFADQPLPRFEDAVSVYRAWREIIRKYKLDPSDTRAGCGRCNGCFPLREILEYGM